MKHQVRKRAYADTHTQEFYNLPPHTEAGIRIIKREKVKIPSLLQNNIWFIHIHPLQIWSDFESPNSALLLTHLTRSLKLSCGK